MQADGICGKMGHRNKERGWRYERGTSGYSGWSVWGILAAVGPYDLVLAQETWFKTS